MNKLSKFLFAALIALIAVSCGENREKEIKLGNFKVLFHEFGEGEKIDSGDYVFFSYQYVNGKDSVLNKSDKEILVLSTFDEPTDVRTILYEAVKGDSLSVYISADSLYSNGPYPAYIDSGSTMRWDLKIIDTRTKKSLDDEVSSYLEKKGIEAEKTESGLYYNITKKTEGKQAKAGNMVTVHYTGKLFNDTIFDSSVDRDQPFTFYVGQGKVIPGWDEGVQLLKEGEKAEFIIPQELAYGTKDNPTIPALSPLYFEIEVLEVFDFEEQMKTDSTAIAQYVSDNSLDTEPLQYNLHYIETKKGNGRKAEMGSTVKLKYTGKFLDGTVFDEKYVSDSTFDVVFGRQRIVSGWHLAFQERMTEGGKATLIVPSLLAFGPVGYGDIVPPNTNVIYDIEIVGIEAPKEPETPQE